MTVVRACCCLTACVNPSLSFAPCLLPLSTYVFFSFSCSLPISFFPSLCFHRAVKQLPSLQAVKCYEAICVSGTEVPAVEAEVRSELAELLLGHTWNMTEACQHLERANLLLGPVRGSLGLKCRVLSQLGRCRVLTGQSKLALQAYEKAADLAHSGRQSRFGPYMLSRGIASIFLTSSVSHSVSNHFESMKRLPLVLFEAELTNLLLNAWHISQKCLSLYCLLTCICIVIFHSVTNQFVSPALPAEVHFHCHMLLSVPCLQCGPCNARQCQLHY
jgi:hypothetical protein